MARGIIGKDHSYNWLLGFSVAMLFFVNDLVVSVKITNLSIPRWIENGTADEVILDCEYTVSDKDSRLVLKWFLNDDPNTLHQWIPELKLSSTTDKFQGRIFGEAMQQTNQWQSSATVTKHRSLRIKKPTIDLTGKYRCDIVTLENQDYAEGVMVVYAPPKELEFSVSDSPDGSANLSCEAEGVFPLPQLRVYQVIPGTANRKLLAGKKTSNQRMGVYNIGTLIELDVEEMDKKEPMYFECELLIQGTDYKTNSKIHYLPRGIDTTGEPTDGSSTMTSNFVLVLISVLVAGGIPSLIYTLVFGDKNSRREKP